MKIIGVIPARYGSTRFEGKVLAEINGKAMIQHVWERTKESNKLDDVIIACDSEQIKEAAESFGAKAVLTSEEHTTGTDRIAEAVENLDVDVVINVQGDEPLIHHSVIDDLADLFSDKNVKMATVIKVLEDSDELANPNVVKVAIDDNGDALYFSRSTIPYDRENAGVQCYKHLGIYAYTKDFLFTYKDLPKSKLEKAEQLEQLRVLEAGYKIRTVKTDIETIGVDTPEDLKRVEGLLANG